MHMHHVTGVVASALAMGDDAVITIFPLVDEPHQRLDPDAAIVMGRTRPSWQDRDGHQDFVTHLVGCSGTISYEVHDRPMFDAIKRY